MGFATKLVAIVLVSTTISGLLAVGGEMISRARITASSADLREVEKAQLLALAVDGLYAASYDTFTSGELGLLIQTGIGSEISYQANESRDHYVMATKLSNGQVLVNSDTHREAVTCESYTLECLTLVTSDPQLMNSAPVWTIPVPKTAEV